MISKPVTFYIQRNSPFEPFHADLIKVSMDGDVDYVPLSDREFIALRHVRRRHGEQAFHEEASDLFDPSMLDEPNPSELDELPF